MEGTGKIGGFEGESNLSNRPLSFVRFLSCLRSRDLWSEAARADRTSAPRHIHQAFHDCRPKGPAFAGSVSLHETRKRDVLAMNRLALAAFL